MPHRCAFGCKATDVVMHVFPNPKKRPELFKSWVSLVGADFQTLSDNEIYKKNRICDIHFTYNYKNRFKRLNAMAVPSLHLQNSSKDQLPVITNEQPVESQPDNAAQTLDTPRAQKSIDANKRYITRNVTNLLAEHNYIAANKPRPRVSCAENIMDRFYFIGVDVGSGSVRAALVDQNGHVEKTSVMNLQTWKPKPDYYEQSSDDVWRCCEYVIKNVVTNINPRSVRGIGFDATCSLVALDNNGNPKAVSDSDNDDQNIIMWMDHRAQAEADFINKTGHEILKYAGGKVSLEMEMPKLLWLKRHLPNSWPEYGYFFDLPDFLTWKATGSLSRSLCSLVCKWNYECTTDGKHRWNVDFLKEIGLDDLAKDDFIKIGNRVLMPGDFCGGLSYEVAEELGLTPGTPVATSMIDAHAGGLGMIGVQGKGIDSAMCSRLGLICGTSTCHMAVNAHPVMVKGVWGPYFSAMVPNMWLNEAGQSASGMLLDYIIESHPAGRKLLSNNTTGEVRNYLRELLAQMASCQSLHDVSLLTKDLHVWPDFHGNRSPLSDPTMKGMIVGLTINNSEENLALLYLATIQALAYGTRHIIDALLEAGYTPFKSLPICGGITKDPLFVQIQADAVGLPLLKPIEKESVLVGSAILGACASRCFNNVQAAIQKMGGTADVVHPNKSIKSFHDKKYKVFLTMFQDQISYRNIMNSS